LCRFDETKVPKIYLFFLILPYLKLIKIAEKWVKFGKTNLEREALEELSPRVINFGSGHRTLCMYIGAMYEFRYICIAEMKFSWLTYMFLMLTKLCRLKKNTGQARQYTPSPKKFEICNR
jgi:hypothetical protein